jgi:tetratricopeptide (TPR) repeat protein
VSDPVTTENTGAQTRYSEGVRATRAGEHAQAVALFEQALQLGAVDPATYHGLGNALYRQNQLGAAIASWRRGLTLAPGDGDLSANLERARQQTLDRLEPPGLQVGPFFWLRSISSRNIGWASSFSLFLGLCLLLARMRRAHRTPREDLDTGPSRLAWSLLIVGTILSSSLVWSMRTPETAVVVASQVSVRSAQGDSGIELFVLHEGAELRVVERDGSYALVALSDGRKGWLPAPAVLSAYPSEPFSVL